MILDVRTMYVAMAATCFIVAAVLCVIYAGRFRRDGTLPWTVGWSLQGVFFLFIGLRGVMWDFVSIVLANTCLTAGYSLIYAAVCQLRDRSYRSRPLFLPPVVTFVFFFCFSVFTDNLFARTVFISALTTMQAGAIAWVLFREAPVSGRRAYWLTAFALSVTSVLFFCRFMEALVLPSAELPILTATVLRNASMAMSFTVAIIASMGFVLMRQSRAEETLRESEKGILRAKEEWERTFDAVPDMIAVLDNEHRLLRVNRAMARRLGLTPEQCIGLPCYQAIHGTLLPPSSCPHSRTISDGLEHIEEVHADRLGGDFIVSTTPLCDDHGLMMGSVHVAHDITERKASGEALRRSEELYRSLFDNMLNGFAYCKMVYDDAIPTDWTYVSVNRAFEALTGLEGVTGKKVSEIIPGIRESDPKLFDIYGRVALSGVAEQFEIYVEALRMWFSVSVYSPQREYFVAVFDVITGRKRAEETLRHAHDDLERRVGERTRELARQANLLNLTEDAVFVKDRENRITFWNRGAEVLYGWTEEEARGKVAHELLYTRFPEPVDTVNRVLSTRGRWEGELQQSTKDSRTIKVSSHMVRWDEDGRPSGILEVNRDVTAQKQTEAQLRQAQKMEALGTLSGGIAHDFNNILAAIMGFAELIGDHASPGSREGRHARRILEAGIRGRELVRQMLTFSRKTEREKKPLQLSSVVKEAAKLLRASIPSTISLKVSVKGDSGVILGDPIQIHQILMNLATNSAHAMREKGGVLEIELANFDAAPSNGNPHGMEPGPYMRLTVRDTGAGIAPEIVERVFDPFFTTKKVGEGTGLGLSVVLGIVKQSHGYVTVESDPGRGATFDVYFPKITDARTAAGKSEDETIPVGDESILFVDDETALLEVGEELLAELGYEVTCRTSSREALALFRLDPSRFDLVVTDQTMPEMTGMELAAALLAIRPDLPVLLATGFSYLVDADSARAAGVKAFVVKPLTKREIARAVRQALDGQTAPAPQE